MYLREDRCEMTLRTILGQEVDMSPFTVMGAEMIDRLDSFIRAVDGQRLTYERLTA